MREILAIGEDEYPLYGNFKQKIIQKGINDLEKHTDLFVTKLEEVKLGRAVDAVVFYLNEKPVPRQIALIPKKLSRQVIKSSSGSIVVATHTPDENIISPAHTIVNATIVAPQQSDDNNLLAELYEKIQKYKIAKSTLER